MNGQSSVEEVLILVRKFSGYANAPVERFKKFEPNVCVTAPLKDVENVCLKEQRGMIDFPFVMAFVILLLINPGLT